MSNNKAMKWIKRYGLAELAATTTAVSLSYLVPEIADYFSGGKIEDSLAYDAIAGYAGMIGDNIGFYGTMFFQDIKKDKAIAQENNQTYGLKGVLKTSKNLALEFSIAEILDSFIIRPFTIGTGAKYIGTTKLGKPAGAFIGKVVADISFYVNSSVSRNYIEKHRNKNN